jgi:hypothetical protein
MTEATDQTQVRGNNAVTEHKKNADVEFVWETLKKVGLFLVIAGAAAVLHLIVLLLEYYGMPNAITYPLTFVEYALLVFDIIWFLKGLVTEIGSLLLGVIAGSLLVRVLICVVIFTLGAIMSEPLKKGILAVFRAIGQTADAVDPPTAQKPPHGEH